MANLEDKFKAKDARQGQVVSRPATREDILAFSSVVKWPTTKAWIAEFEGEAVALGGFATIKGRHIGFLDVTEKGRDLLERNLMVKVALIRAMREGMEDARKRGVRYVYAEADTQFPKACELLERMGFHIDPRSRVLHRWKNDNGSD